MLNKFETKSNRVKGLALHPQRPWVLAALHNGLIQLWNYLIGTKLDEYAEHEGPVRGIDFHASQPLFVSGGDDYKIKLWNYKLRRCLFTLHGHLDYVRTVKLHPTNAWIVSASDDQCIRIWDWQSRTCLSVLTGHNHYVMCASFHPTEHLLVSASLDQTVRVWDISGLRRGGGGGGGDSAGAGGLGGSASAVVTRLNTDLFGRSDAIVKFTMDGHDRGVNWASFHPTMPIIVSGADDNQVKLWRTNEAKAWEMDSLRGHVNNVSCVIFHRDQGQDLIISNSEDRTIRVWDTQKRLNLQTYRREHDRFWTLVSHPTRNLLAAGHDTGLMVFKLHRERPAMTQVKNTLFYIKDRELFAYDYGSGRDEALLPLQRRAQLSNPWAGIPREVHVNPFDKTGHHIIIVSDLEGGSYELYSTASKSVSDLRDVAPKRGNCVDAVFVARNKFAVLLRSKQIWIRTFDNEVSKKSPVPFDSVDGMFFAGVTGRILLRSEDKVWLYDHTSRRVLAHLHVSRVRRVVWSKNYEFVALLSKNNVVVADRDLKFLASAHEIVRVKGGAWDDSGVFIFSTLNHIKWVECLLRTRTRRHAYDARLYLWLLLVEPAHLAPC
jgi:coatomer protein complex subunit alpha (xenin)